MVAGPARDHELAAALGGLAIAPANAGKPPGHRRSGFGRCRSTRSTARSTAALADGMKIILLPYRYPKWANGTEDRVFGNAEDS